MTASADAPASRRGAIGLVLGLVFFAVALVLPRPEGLTPAGWHTAAMAVLMATWWVTEAVPIPVTALLPIVLLPVLGVQSIDAAAAPYANPVIFLFMGGFLIAAALERSGLHTRMALTIISRGGTAPARLVAAFMVATAFISMWVSNTATVAMMLPLASSIVALVERGGAPGQPDRDPNFPTALMLGLTYAASIGGLATLIGTPPNALLAGFMGETYGVEIGFGQWMIVGVPLVIVALPAAWFLLVRVLFPVSSRPIAGGAATIERERAALGRPSRAEWTVGFIAGLTAVAWIVRPWLNTYVPALSDTGIAMGGALLLFLVPVDWRHLRTALAWDAAERLPWGVLLLFGGGLSLAAAASATGLDTWIGSSLSWVAGWPLVAVVLVVATVTMFLTELTSNSAVTAAFLPVAASLAAAIGTDPMQLAVTVALAASCAFMLPVATPPNAIVYGTGLVTLPQMMRAGVGLNVMCLALITTLVLALVPRVFGS